MQIQVVYTRGLYLEFGSLLGSSVNENSMGLFDSVDKHLRRTKRFLHTAKHVMVLLFYVFLVMSQNIQLCMVPNYRDQVV